MISKTIDIVVTSVLQTTAGKMIFGRYVESSPVQPQAASSPAVAASTAPSPVPPASASERSDDKARVRQPVSSQPS
jgi:hypothetical protein